MFLQIKKEKLSAAIVLLAGFSFTNKTGIFVNIKHNVTPKLKKEKLSAAIVLFFKKRFFLFQIKLEYLLILNIMLLLN